MQKDELQIVAVSGDWMQYFSISLGPNLDFFVIGKSIQKDVDQSEVDVFLTSAFHTVAFPHLMISKIHGMLSPCANTSERPERSRKKFYPATLSSASPLVLQPSWEKPGEGRVKWVPQNFL
jgi:hypothetical protein